MAKLVVTLEQHTPLIHFQADQEGAMLRASEFKPKLDKYLIKHAFGNDFKVYNKYLIGYAAEKSESDFTEKKALDYKVKIITDTGSIKRQIVNSSLYMGNMRKDDSEKVKSVFTDKDIMVEFFSLNSSGGELLEAIRRHIPAFLAVNNFGARQNKGFGSFYIKGQDDVLENISAQKSRFLYIDYPYKGNTASIIEDVATIYSLMKSGLNYPDHPRGSDGRLDRSVRGNRASYHKSFFFEYMLDKNIGNEKRFIKENFFSPQLRIQGDGKTKKYVRALLGLTSWVQFADDRRGRITYRNADIERYKSPITFKVVKGKLFILPEEMNRDIFNKRFVFSDGIAKLFIYTPNENEFDIWDFLSRFADYFNSLQVSDAANKVENSLRRAKQNVIIKAGVQND